MSALAEVLRSPGIAGFEVITLINEPHYRVGEAIADLYRDRRQDDLTLLYFTGHGLKDAFPAGALAKSDSAVQTLERFRGRGRAVLTASDSTQYSFEGNQMHGSAPQPVFTRHLVAGLRNGSADLDDDGDITIDELYHYVYDRVTDEMPQQRPKKLDSVEGRLVIARNVNWSPPAAEPGAETGRRAGAMPAGPGEPPTLAAP